MMTLAAFLMSALLTPMSHAPADMVVVSARIWTGDPARPEAEALAVKEKLLRQPSRQPP
jgi:hypothetical protein